YTDPQCLFIAVQGFGQQVPLGSAAAMYLTRRLDRAFCVLSLTDRKIEELPFGNMTACSIRQLATQSWPSLDGRGQSRDRRRDTGVVARVKRDCPRGQRRLASGSHGCVVRRSCRTCLSG